MNHGLTIVIPCLNEKATIANAILVARKAGKKYLKKNFQIIVVDNGSTDGTFALVKKIKGIQLIQVPVRGYGAALHSGIIAAKYPYVLFADADLSYDFLDLNKFLPFINQRYDLVLGSRYEGVIAYNAMPFTHRYFGTPLLTALIRSIYGIDTTDCNSGMRMVKKAFYRKLHITNSGMEWASELLIKTALAHGSYTEVPITFCRDKRNRRPHLKSWEDGWRHLKVIILLKPSMLLAIALLLILLGLSIVKTSLFTTIALFLFAEFFILSFLATKILEGAIEHESNWVTKLLNRLPLVAIAVFGTAAGLVQLFIISDEHLFTKYIFLYQSVMFDLWLFFIETVKTHIVNRLPKQ